MSSTSLFVSKADWTREELDRVTLEMAREIFAMVDWDEELRAAQSAQETEGDCFVPEFGLTDEQERLLVITPVDSETVGFSIQSPIYGWSVEKFPKGEVATLLERYFAGDDDALQELAVQHQSVREIQIHELSESEFAATMAGEMREAGEAEAYKQIKLRDYLGVCIDALSLPTSLETIELANIRRAADDRHSHFLFNYGDPARALVLVVAHAPDPELRDVVIGHRFQSLAADTLRGVV